jgi:hypothetical protein
MRTSFALSKAPLHPEALSFYSHCTVLTPFSPSWLLDLEVTKPVWPVNTEKRHGRRYMHRVPSVTSQLTSLVHMEEAGNLATGTAPSDEM